MKMIEYIKNNKLKSFIFALMLICVLPFWPLGVFRDSIEHRTGNSGHALTAPLKQGERVVQSFKAVRTRLTSIDFVIDFEEDLRSGSVLFEVLDPDNDVIFETVIPYSQIPGYSYCRVDVNLKLKKYRTYSYRITNIDIADNLPVIVYETDEKEDALPNNGMDFGGTAIEGNSLTRYIWDVPIRFYHILAIYACIGTVGFTVIEFLDGNLSINCCKQY